LDHGHGKNRFFLSRGEPESSFSVGWPEVEFQPLAFLFRFWLITLIMTITLLHRKKCATELVELAAVMVTDKVS
jgi:hypothetical protein